MTVAAMKKATWKMTMIGSVQASIRHSSADWPWFCQKAGLPSPCQMSVAARYAAARHAKDTIASTTVIKMPVFLAVMVVSLLNFTFPSIF